MVITFYINIYIYIYIDNVLSYKIYIWNFNYWKILKILIYKFSIIFKLQIMLKYQHQLGALLPKLLKLIKKKLHYMMSVDPQL